MAEVMREIPQEDLKLSEKESTRSIQGYNATLAEPNPALDKRISWRRDLVLVPIMGILYMILFLDRTNIANARSLGIGQPNGLEMSLNMPSNGYNTALWIFYIPFVLAEVPANLLLSRNFVRPGILLGGQMFILGVVSMCQGLTKSFGGLLACRFIMGIFEVSLPAGATYMMASYYTRREAAIRFAWFFNFALAGPLFSGLLAFAIAGLDGAGGLFGWRWIFVIEGLVTIVLSVLVIFACPNFPQDAQEWFLKPHERERLVYQLELSRGAEIRGSAIDKVPLWKVLIDWRIHLFTMCFFCCDITAASISAFSPTILTELGWTASIAQLMTMPIWASGIVSAFLFTWLASRLNKRTPFVLFCICMQLAGWIIMRVYVKAVGVRYFALFLMSMGTFPQMPTLMGWLSANLRGHKYLAVGMGWMIGFGNCANFVSSNVFITTERPYYPTGFSVGLGFTALGFSLVTLAYFMCILHNKKYESRREGMTDAERERDNELHFKLVY